MLAAPYLTNCYIPSIEKEEEEKKIDVNNSTDIIQKKYPNRYYIENINNDIAIANSNINKTNPNSKRSTKELRCVSIDRNILSKSNGSSIIEIGNTRKVICNVHGPRSSSLSFNKTQHNEFQGDGTLNCEIRYAPYYSMDDNNNNTSSSNKEIELSERIRDVMLRSIPIHKLSKSVIDIYIMVLQDDDNDGSSSSIFNACIISASIALADAGIELYDMISSCSVAVVQYTTAKEEETLYMYLLDPTGQEENDNNDDDCNGIISTTIVTLAMLCNWKEVVFLDQRSSSINHKQHLPSIVSLKAMELCRDGCMIMSKFMNQCLLKHEN